MLKDAASSSSSNDESFQRRKSTSPAASVIKDDQVKNTFIAAARYELPKTSVTLKLGPVFRHLGDNSFLVISINLKNLASGLGLDLAMFRLTTPPTESKSSCQLFVLFVLI